MRSEVDIQEYISWIARRVVAVVGLAVVLFLLLPILSVIPMSFNDAALFEIIPSNPSLDQYRRLFASEEWMDALGLSVRVAVLVMILATALGLLAATAIIRIPGRYRPVAEAMFLSPQIVPSVVIAASAYFVFLQLGLMGTTTAIVLMHSVIALPFVVVLMTVRLEALSPDLAHASSSLGAKPWYTFYRIILPQIATTVLGCALFVFHISFDEVVISLFLSGARNKTLPVKLWDAIQFEVTPLLPAISTLVLLIPALLFIPIILVRARSFSR